MLLTFRLIDASAKHVPYGTDSICLVESASLVCYQAALVLATGLPLDELGMLPIAAESGDRASFAKMQSMFNACAVTAGSTIGACFHLCHMRHAILPEVGFLLPPTQVILAATLDAHILH